MNAPSSIFTASKLAAVLSCTKRNVLDRLAGVEPKRIISGGQQAKGYALTNLPKDMVIKLEELKTRFQFRSIDQLVMEGLPAGTWKPCDLKLIHDTEIDEASALMRAMRRVLKINSTTVSALVDMGLADYRSEFGKTISEGYWRKLYDQIVARDAGAGKFDDLRLFVRDNPKLKDDERSAPTEADIQLEILYPFLKSIEKVGELTSDQAALIWHFAFEQVEQLALNGVCRRAARAMTLDCISGRGIRLAKTPKALSKAWVRNYAAWVEGGQTSAALNDGRKDNGRNPLIVMTEDEVHAVQSLVLMTDPNDGRRISVSMALRMFAQTPECREELRQAILKGRCSKHKITSVLKAQARVTPETKMLERGPRTLKLGGHKQPRGLFYINKAGEETPILPGDLWESDDMHVNQPFYCEWFDENDPCSRKFGVRAFRAQLLPILDIGSGRFVSYGLTLRHTDAYRASDILWTFLNAFRSVGVPQHLRFEQGVWSADTVRRLEACSKIHTSYTPGTKFIENRFNVLQKVMGVHGVNVGRKRGEFELTNKHWTAVREGKMHPKDAGFLSAHQMSEALTKSMLWINADPMEGEIYKGVPDEIWTNHFQSVSALPKLTPIQSILLQPERREVMIDSGHVRCRVAEHNATFYFSSPADFAKYGSGYKVTVCFDPSDPAAGAYILNREEGAKARRNAEGTALKIDELMCWAEHVERVPQFSMASRVDERESFERKKRFTEQCRLMYGTIMPFNKGTPYRVAQANDGRGHVERVEVEGTQITRREQGAAEKSVQKTVLQVRAKERQLGLRKTTIVKNPDRVLEGINDYEKAMAQLEQEEGN